MTSRWVRRWALGLCCWAGTAHAWTHRLGPDVSLPAPVVALRVVRMEMGTPVVLAMGTQVSWIVDPMGGRVLRTLPHGGVDAAIVDMGTDGRRELLLCGPSGLWVLPWDGVYGGGASVLDPGGCDQVEVIEVPGVGPLVVATMRRDPMAVESTLEGWAVGGETPRAATLGPLPEAFRDPLLVGHDELLAIVERGAERFYEWHPAGVSHMAAGGALGGIDWGARGWTWTLPRLSRVDDLTHDARMVGPEPRELSIAQLDGHDGPDLVIRHGEHGPVGVLLDGDTHERLLSTPVGTSSVAVGDLDLDGCADVVFGTTSPRGVSSRLSVGCGISPPEEPPPEPDPSGERAPVDRESSTKEHAPLPESPPRVLGLELSGFLGEPNALPLERRGLHRYVVVGSGWAMGSAIRNVWLQIPFFPAFSISFEIGGPHVRWFVGGDSAALLLWMTERGNAGIHLANATSGVMFGSPRLRFGPFGTAGVLSAGAGIRAVWTPWANHDVSRGIEVRLTWFAPGTGEVMVLYTWSRAMGRVHPSMLEAAPVTGASERGEARMPVRTGRRSAAGYPGHVPAFLACRRVGMGIGVAFGASSTRYSWEFVGSSLPVSFSGSPTVSLRCETGTRHGGLLIGLESAPFYSYLSRSDERFHQLGSLTIGPMVGGDGFRVGPIGTAGLWSLGAGGRALVRLARTRRGLEHVLDIRATAHVPSSPAGQLMVLYGVAYDPWRHRGSGVASR